MDEERIALLEQQVRDLRQALQVPSLLGLFGVFRAVAALHPGMKVPVFLTPDEYASVETCAQVFGLDLSDLPVGLAWYPFDHTTDQLPEGWL